ncbi:MAG: hypothetical protein KDB03_16860 [Planctomycetales bacterium]|nr:hypothetical protein [Planctomycetales bacterium]
MLNGNSTCRNCDSQMVWNWALALSVVCLSMPYYCPRVSGQSTELSFRSLAAVIPEAGFTPVPNQLFFSGFIVVENAQSEGLVNETSEVESRANDSASLVESPVGDENSAANPTTAESVGGTEISAGLSGNGSAEESIDPTPEGSVRNLSVEPGHYSLLPENHPDWVGAPPKLTGEVHELYVGSLPCFEMDELDANLEEALLASIWEYVDGQVLHDSGAAEQLKDKLTVNYVRRNLLEDPNGYVAELNTGGGKMLQRWVKIQVTPEQREQIQVWHREYLQHVRLRPLGIGIACVLLVVGGMRLMIGRHRGPNVQAVQLPNPIPLNAAFPAKRHRSGFLFGLILTMAIGVGLLSLLAGLRLVDIKKHRQAVVVTSDIRASEAMRASEIKTKVLEKLRDVLPESGSGGNVEITLEIPE